MKRATVVAAMAAAVGLAAWAAVRAAEEAAPSVETIVQKTNYTAYYQGKDGRAQVKMTITDAQGRERTREFAILRRDSQGPDAADPAFTGEQKFYVYFHRPADVNKMVFMVHKYLTRDDDRWLYLPALDLVKRIAAADKRTSFVGSHFLYEDVSGRTTEADVHELVETTDNYYVLKNTPKAPDTVEFAYYKMWIHRKTFVAVKTEYYDKQDARYREYTALKVETIDGFPTVTKARMADTRMGGETVNEYSDVKYNTDLPDDIFTEQYLRNPPRKHLK
jgi:outer membrane lipoprotein-sorting protein